MSSTNAPQPDANGPAEVFDSTVAPPQGQVSQDQLPGGNTIEAPVHVGQVNGIDPYFTAQFIPLTSFIWDISQSPGQLLWYCPIHPQFVHQFMAHLAKMYNAFAGGFTFSLTIAGTGFHAGKLVVVRLPPNIHPNKLNRIQDIGAFPYYIIDPKTLETVVKSAMDQRDVMYHYLPYDAQNFRTFGGYIAVYVMLPLATSATGQSQISVQVLTKPDPDFRFAQVIPIDNEILNPFTATEYEQALNFLSYRSDPLMLKDIESMTINVGTEIKELGIETFNCAKLDGTPMNGEFVKRFSSDWVLHWSDFDGFTSENVAISATTQGGSTFAFLDQTTVNVSFNSIAKFPGADPKTNKLPNFTCKEMIMTVYNRDSKVLESERMGPSANVELREKKATDTANSARWVLAYQNYGFSFDYSQSASWMARGPLHDLLQNGNVELRINMLERPVFVDSDVHLYAPPIPESIITFSNGVSDMAQPYELTQAILSKTKNNVISKNDSLVFELWDKLADLPLLPIRLHFDGYFTTLAVQQNVVYKFQDPLRYYFVFISLLPETTPMTSGKINLKPMSQYRTNNAISQQLTARFFN